MEIPQTYPVINYAFNVCNSTNSSLPEIRERSQVEDLIYMISDNLGTMAMVNYPYATNFVKNLPAWPVKASCYNASGVFENEQGTRDFNFKNIERLAAMYSVW